MTATATDTTGIFPVQDRKIGNFSVDSVTDAPLQVEVRFELNLPQQKAFDLMFSGIDRWFKQVSGVKWDHASSSNGPNSGGENSTRTCGFDGKKLFETIVFYDAPNAYGYEISIEKSTASFPVKDPLGVFLVKAAGSDKSIVSWRQYFNKRIHPLALVIKPMMKSVLMKKNIKTGLIDVYGGRFI